MNAADVDIYSRVGNRVAVMKGFVMFNLANQAIEIVLHLIRAF